MSRRLVLAVLILVGLGCPRATVLPRVCVPASSRCMADAEYIEVCDAGGQWVRAQTCEPVDGVRTYCVEGPAGAACILSEVP